MGTPAARVGQTDILTLVLRLQPIYVVSCATDDAQPLRSGCMTSLRVEVSRVRDDSGHENTPSGQQLLMFQGGSSRMLCVIMCVRQTFMTKQCVFETHTQCHDWRNGILVFLRHDSVLATVVKKVQLFCWCCLQNFRKSINEVSYLSFSVHLEVRKRTIESKSNSTFRKNYFYCRVNELSLV